MKTAAKKKAKKPERIPPPTPEIPEGHTRFWNVLFKGEPRIMAESYMWDWPKEGRTKVSLFVYGHGWCKVAVKDMSWIADEPFTNWSLWKMSLPLLQVLLAEYGYKAISNMDQSIGLQCQISIAWQMTCSPLFAMEFASKFGMWPQDVDMIAYERYSANAFARLLGFWQFDLVRFDQYVLPRYGYKPDAGKESMQAFMVRKWGWGFVERFRAQFLYRHTSWCRENTVAPGTFRRIVGDTFLKKDK